MARLEDVARRVGVSTATVSRVLSGSAFVSEELRERVLSGVREMNYSPNGVARSMAQRRTLTLGLIVSDVTNPFFTALARGVEDVGNDAGYSIVLCNTDESLQKEQSYLNVLREKRVDGILLAICSDTVEHVQRVIDSGAKLVLIDRSAPDIDAPLVHVDNEGGMRQATRYLLSLGHRRIAIIVGSEHVATAKDRLLGYSAALAEAGITLDSDLVIPGGFTESGGYDAALRLWQLEDRPTAVVSSNNVMTTGLLLAFKETHIRIPEDISVISFDDLPHFSLLDHPLTVISQPTYELGRVSCELLLSIVTDNQAPSGRESRLCLPTQLTVRESCLPLPPGR
jgi:LacI family transcriptional regulator